VGIEMVREAAEVYYRHNEFRLDDDKLKELLGKDVFQVGVRPADHIRKLWVPIAYGIIEEDVQFGMAQSFFPTDDADIDDLRAGELRLYEDGRKKLSHLLLLKNRDQLDIRLQIFTVLEDETQDRRRFCNILESMRDTMYDLMHSGAEIRLEHYNREGNFGHDLIRIGKDGKSDPKMITKLSKDEWEKVCC
jgi:hypothetical protein